MRTAAAALEVQCVHALIRPNSAADNDKENGGKHPLLISPDTYKWRKQSRANETGHEQKSDGLFREAVLLAIKRVNIRALKPVRTYTIPMSTPLVPGSALTILQKLGRTHNNCIDGQVLPH